MVNVFVQRSKVLQISLVAIFSAFVVELVFGMISNSLALITDSIHALLDCVVTAILLLAARMAIKPPDAEHTYGHGKMEALGGLIGGIAIFLIAVFFIYESVHRMQGPPPSVMPGLFAVFGGIYTIGIDCFRILLLRRSIKKIGGITLKADIYHAFMDLGSTLVAIAGVVLTAYGFYSGDFVAAMILGVLLAILSIKLVYKSAQDLTDTISPETVNSVRKIVTDTDGVVRAGPIMMRRSGDTIFADIIISLKGDVSFDNAHRISDRVEENIMKKISNSSVTIHFEPIWDKVPVDTKIYNIVKDVDGVRGVHNISTHEKGDMTYVNLHVMVDREMSLASAHRVSEAVEQKIQDEIERIGHVTVHLEPFTRIPEKFRSEDRDSEEEIRDIMRKRVEIKKIGRIVSLNFGDIRKIDIDCSFERNASIETVHDLISEIEHEIRTKIKNSVITIHPEPS